MRRNAFYKRIGMGMACALALLFLLGGCAPRGQTPEATLEPGVVIGDGSFVQPDSIQGEDTTMVETREVSLYYRMTGENMLACETRTLLLPKDKQVQEVVVGALIGGPSSGLLELSGLFNADTKVTKTWTTGDMLTITLSRQFLDPPADAPVLWENDPTWRTEVLMRRQLALASIVNTITEATSFTSVQFLVLDWGEENTGRRLYRSELYEDAEKGQLLAPVTRSEQFLLTHYNTANLLMQCWRSQSFDRIYRFVAQEASHKPTEAAFRQEMVTQNRPLLSFSVSAGMVSEDGQRAVLEASYDYLVDGQTVQVRNYPMRLVRENGVWKITYAELTRMMEAL